ncbi:hypothetical protein IGI04_012511 [Brassica rapa subsp. trilocularis]|uniref:Uncharacterized protein n=1 Tax=Brassica rapa subsp. trilocularis TaxID=1813537 RepID=A0ABQ7N639_BRACM|nr:hypothetical protein IGI04_012511 [Brassica rapa subsp. trilocularis]
MCELLDMLCATNDLMGRALSGSDTGVLTMTSCKLDGRVSNLQSLLQRRRGK